MQTILEDMRSGISEEGIRLGGEILKQGGLVAFPTETVYGLGGNALDAEASAKIYAAKGRPSDNPQPEDHGQGQPVHQRGQV